MQMSKDDVTKVDFETGLISQVYIVVRCEQLQNSRFGITGGIRVTAQAGGHEFTTNTVEFVIPAEFAQQYSVGTAIAVRMALLHGEADRERATS